MTASHVLRVRGLYKAILRLHRGLPPALQPLGDSYARDEFKRHKKCNEAEANVFMNEWTNYAIELSKQFGLKGKPSNEIGKNLTETELDKFKEDQIVQLHRLMEEATKTDDSETNSNQSNEIKNDSNDINDKIK